MTEKWLPIPGVPYEASDAGRIRNAKTERVLKSFPHKSGYLQTQLQKNRQPWTVGVHQLVALAFHGAAPSAEHEVGHGDGNRHNNAPSNLRWLTHLENMIDRDVHGGTARGARNGKTVHSPETISTVRSLKSSGLSCAHVAKLTGVSVAYVYTLATNPERRA